ncbi:MAG: hypothetical protein COZ06_09315 [Armatimonadetes bacterium CG_4_10_14_3_um_filter_66_18]|nr:MAG: hypothetical protein COS65_03695 [Armatimonadetes bacterium CG06_land_8_20_14_3_00_66_21]PIX37513.1 MAG: hypothetical protein COZ57_33965 [Armatimonadetes bacterium CG_4_8_14_3_um_filter_66_20]PIY50445.1 MAG: hypothetical protein COZ06_09315 [Armatimonadetes bacterium CG_4_10_14_3_um_filter_66_18]PIZ43964.1 MAG: hypothetical protein COY42_14960 [Armatimonadetes bacterium CG_4_10_14_0_8_um_filter_66_14]PJB62369.1 MAG: hypothetical protein CO096_25775 [Armatimonadetes bacterium CG_4_9_14_
MVSAFEVGCSRFALALPKLPPVALRATMFSRSLDEESRAMSMAWIRRCVLSEQYRFTRHAGERMRRRQLSRAEVAEVLTGGGIIETTTDEHGFTCWLISGQRFNGDDVHVAAKRVGNVLQVNTVYFPDEQFWESDARTRR